MDIQLPEIDGKEATRRIRAQGYQNPVIALTAHTLREERESCIASGCNDQITKPITGHNFIKQVQNHLGLSV
jgi:CheY-like chemotaxis protein